MHHKSLDMAIRAGCRSFLENYGLSFVKRHNKSKLCTHVFGIKPTTADIFSHFEWCRKVTSGDKLLGDELSEVLDIKDIKLPTSGSFATIFNSLSARIHNASLIKDSNCKILVPDDLSTVEKRFYIRFSSCS